MSSARLRLRRPHRRACFLALIVATLGLGPLVDLAGHNNPADLAAAAAIAAADPRTPPVEERSPTSGPPPVIVVARGDSWTRYVDLAIRLVALVLAWLTEPERRPPPADVARRHPLR